MNTDLNITVDIRCITLSTTLKQVITKELAHHILIKAGVFAPFYTESEIKEAEACLIATLTRRTILAPESTDHPTLYLQDKDLNENFKKAGDVNRRKNNISLESLVYKIRCVAALDEGGYIRALGFGKDIINALHSDKGVTSSLQNVIIAFAKKATNQKYFKEIDKIFKDIILID